MSKEEVQSVVHIVGVVAFGAGTGALIYGLIGKDTASAFCGIILLIQGWEMKLKYLYHKSKE